MTPPDEQVADLQDTPDGMRRSPQQERSRRMVNAIVESGRWILLNHGASALTTTSLSHVSGVAKGSIYQYFASLDAVKAEIFQEEIKHHLNEWYQDLLSQWDSLTLNDGVALIVDSALTLHTTLMRLDEEFYLRYSGYYDLWSIFDKYSEENNAGAELLKRFIESHYKGDQDTDTRLLAFALGRSIQQTTYSLVRDEPDFLHHPQLRNVLLKIGLSLFKT